MGIGGAERQWTALIPALRDHGLQVSLLTLYEGGPFAQELRRKGVTIESARMSSRADIRGLRRAVGGPSEVDLVVSQSFAGKVIAHAIATRMGAPHVTTEHHASELPRRIHERLALRLLTPHVHATVAVSATQIPDLVKLGYRRDRIRVIPNGVAALAPQRPRGLVRRELGLDDEAFVAILAATLRPEKQAQLFVDAVARANEANARIRGLVAGAGPELEKIDALARATGGIVQTLGNRSDVLDLMGAAETVCLSSLTEALPMACLEAMALAKPVIATDVGGMRDVVEPERTGLLVPRNNTAEFAAALVRLAEDPDLAARLGARAKERQMSRFSSVRMVGDYARLLASVAT